MTLRRSIESSLHCTLNPHMSTEAGKGSRHWRSASKNRNPNHSLQRTLRAAAEARRSEKLNRGISAILTLTGIALVVACSGKPPKTESASESDLPIKKVRVGFDLPGDDIGGQESQEILNMIKAEIVTRQLSEVESAGFGMGNMVIVLRYEDGGSVEELRRAIVTGRTLSRPLNIARCIKPVAPQELAGIQTSLYRARISHSWPPPG